MKSLRRILALALAAAPLLGSEAFADHNLAARLCGPLPAPRLGSVDFRFPAPRFEWNIGFGWQGASRYAPAVHVHRWSFRAHQTWVEPVYATRLAGYDACGRPIYHRYLVRSGYWRTVYSRVCGCGATLD